MNAIRILFSQTGIIIVVYIILGVFINTAAPHLPANGNLGGTMIHSWVQYFISILFWPLSFWHPDFTVGKWTGH